MWWGFLVLGSKQHCGYCVITSIAVSDAEDLGCSVAVPDSQQPVAPTWVVKDTLVDDVVGIACIALVSTEMGKGEIKGSVRGAKEINRPL